MEYIYNNKGHIQYRIGIDGSSDYKAVWQENWSPSTFSIDELVYYDLIEDSEDLQRFKMVWELRK